MCDHKKYSFQYPAFCLAQDTTTPQSDTTTPVPNPCEGITLSDCVIDAEIIVGSNPFPPSLCQKQCELIDTCTYWRHDGTTCYYLNSDYHQDCATFSGPVDADILSCLQVDQSTCGAIIEEECVYEGRDGKCAHVEEHFPHSYYFSHLGGWSSSDLRCVGMWGVLSGIISTWYWLHFLIWFLQNLVDFGFDVTAFVFDAPMEECQVYTSSYSKTCSGLGGPATAPNLDVCLQWSDFIFMLMDLSIILHIKNRNILCMVTLHLLLWMGNIHTCTRTGSDCVHKYIQSTFENNYCVK